jgi:hypothetical protein
MTTFRDLANPVDELAEAVAALLDPPAPELFEVDWRAIGAELPSLLDQLEDAVESSNSHGSKASSVYKAPAHLDVVALLTDIDRTIAIGLRSVGYRGRLDLPRAQKIKVWASHAGEWRAVRPDYLHESVGVVRRWVIRGRNILVPDPQTIETRAQPCPQCKSRTAMVWNEDLGERVQRPSLYLDTSTLIVVCRCCGEQWPASMHAFLRRLLEDRPSTETARSAS